MKLSSIFKTDAAPALIPRLIVGAVFLSEGLQKFLVPDAVGAGRFAKIGFPNPEFWAGFVGSFEILSGAMILSGLAIRAASLVTLTIMIVAFITTKAPLLIGKGFWAFAHEYRTDYSMTLLSIYLLIFGSGKRSIDYKIWNAFRAKKLS